MSVNLVCNGIPVDYESLQWSGTDTQCCREVSFSVPYNPYDKEFINCELKLGDMVHLLTDTSLVFRGVITSTERKSEIGTITYVAKDHMYHLLKSNGTFNFKNVTPEEVTKTICADLRISTSDVAKTGINISSFLVENVSYYDIIVKAYTKAAKSNGKKYMPTMKGSSLSVIEKGEHSGVLLTTRNEITSSTYTENLDSMVNKVIICDEKNQKCGVVTNDNWIGKYGIFQQVYNVEENVNQTYAARSMLKGIDTNVSIDAIGNINAISGKAIQIHDAQAGIVGTFWITSDTHTFSNGTHTMKLEVAFQNIMEMSDL